MKRFSNILLRIALAFALFAAAACGDEDGGAAPGPEPPKEIELDAASDLYGFIGDKAGNPVEGVVVSDGYRCVSTDSRGVYQMRRHPQAVHVFYATPANCKIRTGGDAYPDFFVRLAAGSQKIRQDFTLEKLSSPEKEFRLICIGDPQPAKSGEVTRFSQETMTDVRRTADGSSAPCYGVALGDITGEKPDLLAPMRKALGEAGIPVFALPGNHDKYRVDDVTPRDVSYFSQTMGPVDYSFNRGDVHVVCMDDVIYTSGTAYTNGFTDAQLTWLREDLSYVPRERMVILCYHIPLRGGTVRNMAQVKALLCEFAEAHLMCGHTHYNENYVDGVAGGGLYEHIHGAACGVFWFSALNGDGTPNGYAVYDVAGPQIVRWYYKPSLHDAAFQIRLHRGGDVCSGFAYPYTPDAVIANVWNADPSWKVSLHENGVKTKTMTLVTQYTDAWSVGYHVGVLGRGDNYKSPCKHMYVAYPDNPKAVLKVVAEDRWGNCFEQTDFTAPDDFSAARAPEYI